MKMLNYFIVGLIILFSCAYAFGQKREVAITFDDLPTGHSNLQQTTSWQTKEMTENNQKLLATIIANKIPAVGFVNENRLYVRGKTDERIKLLKAWVDAGLELGNHTFSHISIDRNALAAYQKDVIRGETVIRRLLAEKGKKLRYFRHPQLRTGPNLEYKKRLAEFLAARGYTVAPVTIDNNENVFGGAYVVANTRNDAALMKRIGEAYIKYMKEIFEFFEQLSLKFLGYEVKQTLLLHANALNADYFDELVNMMKNRGYQLISLDEALKDKAYALPDAQAAKGLSWLHRWMLAKGLQMRPEPSEPKWIAELYQSYQR
jgi:peptidoglycan/xylan/chitin deacetylase (PgdA/CDA1 family)